MAQMKETPQSLSPDPSSLFSEHLKCSICLEMLRLPIMTAIGCGHRFCETDIKMALKEDRRCPLCREEIRELFHDVFAEQILEDYYKLNPTLEPRERCPPWTEPDPLARININHGVYGRPFGNYRINVQVMAPELSQAERDEISGNIIHIIDMENRFNEVAGLPPFTISPRSPPPEVANEERDARQRAFDLAAEDDRRNMEALHYRETRRPWILSLLEGNQNDSPARRRLARRLARGPFRRRVQEVPDPVERTRQIWRRSPSGMTARMSSSPFRIPSSSQPRLELERTPHRRERSNAQNTSTVLRSGRVSRRPTFYGSN